MAKKDKSLLGSILKGAIDITGEVIKTGYNVATSKEAKNFYKGTAELTKDAIKGTYDAVTSESAKKIYKKTGETAVDMMRFTPPLIKKLKVYASPLLKDENNYLTFYRQCEFNELSPLGVDEKYKNKSIDKKKFKLFKSHWKAIYATFIFGVFQRLGIKGTISKKEYAHLWNEIILNDLKENDPLAVSLIDNYMKEYNVGGAMMPIMLSMACFENKLSTDLVDELNKTWMEVEDIFEQNLPDQNHYP